MEPWRLLGYQASRPRLRLLRLPEEAVEPAPTVLNPPVAISRGFPRDGWIAFTAEVNVWGVPLPLDGTRFRIGRWWDCVPADDPRTVWLGGAPDGDESAPTALVEYDGVARREVSRRELPPLTRLEAVAPAGLVTRVVDLNGDPSLDVVRLWPWEGEPIAVGPGWHVLAAHASLLAVEHRDGRLTLLDLESGAETAIARPLAGEWGAFGSFSPDGTRFAIGIAEESRDARDAAVMPELADAVDGEEMLAILSDPANADAVRRMRKALEAPRWTRLAVVDTATGAVTLAAGRFDNFATRPVWSADGRRLIFDAPFDKSLFVCELDEPALRPVLRRRGRPAPLIDVTAVL